jgi:hypothetical protein
MVRPILTLTAAAALFLLFAAPAGIQSILHAPQGQAVAQAPSAPVPSSVSPVQDQSRESQALYTVMAVIIILWAGIALYMIRLDLRMRKIERETGADR